MSDLYMSFNFEVSITVEDSKQLCECAFSACEGLNFAMEAKTIRSGGDNGRQIHLAGPVANGTLILKRGMTNSFELWEWFDGVTRDEGRGRRAICEVTILGADREPRVGFVLTGCLPTKLSMPSLNAATEEVALEELQIAYETISLKNPNERSGANA